MDAKQKDPHPPCLFELSKNGGCVGTTHDQCKNCNKRADSIMAELKQERQPLPQAPIK